MNEIESKAERILKECGAEETDAGFFDVVRAVRKMVEEYYRGNLWPYGNNVYLLYCLIANEGQVKRKPYSIDNAVRRFIKRLDYAKLESMFRNVLYVRGDYMTSPHDFVYALMKCVTKKE